MCNSVRSRIGLGIMATTVGMAFGCTPSGTPTTTVGSAKTERAFEEITATRLDPFPRVLGWPGIAVFDYDNDADLDIFVTNGPTQANFLYENDGQANFVDVADAAGVARIEDNTVTTGLGDFDNDGRLDLVLGRQIIGTDLLETSTLLLRNRGPNENGQVTFEDVTEAAGLGFHFLALALGVADYNGDGLLDLFCGNYPFEQMRFGDRSALPSMPDVILSNLRIENGIPQFNDETAVARTEGTKQNGLLPETADLEFVPGTIAVHFSDVDADGRQDLFVLHDIPGGIDFFHNEGGGRFSLVAPERFNVSGGWMGVAPGDYDCDGDLDYFMTNLGSTGRGTPPELGYVTSSPFLPGGTVFHRLWNNHLGVLTDVAASISVQPSAFLPPTNDEGGTGLAAYEFGFGCAWIDADNTGHLDLVWTGDIVFSDGGPNRILRFDNHGVGRFLENIGDDTFRDQTAERGLFDMDDESPLAFGRNQPGRALAVADLNNDGFEDIVVSNLPITDVGRVGDIRVYLNPGGVENNWTKIQLRASGGNRFGLGARIIITAGGKTTVKEMVTTTSAFTSVQPLVHFGLGSAPVIDKIEVRWPSGTVTSHLNQPVNQLLTLNEAD